MTALNVAETEGYSATFLAKASILNEEAAVFWRSSVR
jgi:hypothetical protein